MKGSSTTVTESVSVASTGCWNTIGVRGDSSCRELEQHVHCRNCPVYSKAALQLLDGAPPAGYIAEWTNHFAKPKGVGDHETIAVFIFRLGGEWLGLPARAVTEVASLRPIHSVPHRGADLGVANIRGELVVSVSLVKVLGLEQSPASPRDARRTVHQRLLVIRGDDLRVVCVVDEVHGLHRFHSRAMAEVPATVARAAASYSKQVLSWNGCSVGFLDADLLFYSLARSLA